MHLHKHVVHWYLPAVLGVICTLTSVIQVYFFQVNDWDFSYFLHIPWSVSQGTGLIAPFALAFELPFYAHHATPLIALLASLFALFPSPYLLAILHGIAISSCFFLIPLLVREIALSLGEKRYLGVACFLVLLLFCYRPFMAAWHYETHMTTLVTPCVFAALILLHRGKMWGLGLCCLALLLAQERSSVAVACLGMYAFLILGLRRLGFMLCLSSSLYFFAVMKVYFPYVRSALGASTGYAFSDAIQPLYELPQKFMYGIKCILYTLCLPLAGKKALLTAACVLPVVGINLISSRTTMYEFSHHYQDIPTAFWMASAAYGLFWILGYCAQWSWFSATRVRRYAAPACACVCLLLSLLAARFQHPFGLVSTLLAHPHLQEISKLNEDILPILKLDNAITVYAQSSIGPRIALRHNRFTLSADITGKTFSHSVIVVSPLLDTYMLGEYAPAVESLKNNPSLELVTENPRLLIFVSTDMDESVVQSLASQQSI